MTSTGDLLIFQKMNSSLSVIIPVYNEKKTIRSVLSRVLDFPEVGQIIVVDDGSTDGTRQLLSSETFPSVVEIIYGDANYGKSWAIRQALPKVRCDVVVIQDADEEYDPAEYKMMLKIILCGGSDVVYGNRLSSRHMLRHPAHFIGNKFATVLLNIFTGRWIDDMATGLKMFRADLIKDIRILSERFDFDVEFTMKVMKAGHRITSVPIRYKPRDKREGKKMGWRDRAQTLKAIAYYGFTDK